MSLFTYRPGCMSTCGPSMYFRLVVLDCYMVGRACKAKGRSSATSERIISRLQKKHFSTKHREVGPFCSANTASDFSRFQRVVAENSPYGTPQQFLSYIEDLERPGPPLLLQRSAVAFQRKGDARAYRLVQPPFTRQITATPLQKRRGSMTLEIETGRDKHSYVQHLA